MKTTFRLPHLQARKVLGSFSPSNTTSLSAWFVGDRGLLGDANVAVTAPPAAQRGCHPQTGPDPRQEGEGRAPARGLLPGTVQQGPCHTAEPTYVKLKGNAFRNNHPHTAQLLKCAPK